MTRPDYAKIIDAETWAFIDRINSFYPPEAIDYPIARNREIYDRMSRAFHAGRPEGICAETTSIAAGTHDIPIRIYRRPVREAACTILYFHGGGFILGDLDSHDDICADFSAVTGCRVVSVDYRLAPEHTGTAAFDDAMTAFAWTASRYREPLILVGDSAGGNLAACVAHHTRSERAAVAGQVLIYPSLGGDRTQGSYLAHAEAPMLTARDLDFYANIRTPGVDSSADPRFAPLADRDFSSLPPTFIFTAQCDPLASDGPAYRDRVQQAGGTARVHEERGLPHGYLRARTTVGRARDSFGRIVRTVKMIARG